MGLPAYPQVVDLAQKISDWRGQVGGGLDEGITIPKIQSGLWVPQVTLPAVSLTSPGIPLAPLYPGSHFL